MMTYLSEAVSGKWTGIYLRVIACVLLYGASVHVFNILGLSGRRWASTPGLWRAMDVVLLLFNLVVAFGLWTRAPWAVVALVVGIFALQIIPYTVFRNAFIESPSDAATLNGLVGTELILLAILGALLWKRL